MDHAKKIGDAELAYERATTARDEARSKLAAARANEAEAKAKVEIATTALASGSTGSAKAWHLAHDALLEASARSEALSQALATAESNVESAGRARSDAFAEQREAELAADRAEVCSIIDRCDGRLVANEADLVAAREIYARRLAGAAFVARGLWEPTPAGAWRSIEELADRHRRERQGLPAPHWSGNPIVAASERQATANAQAASTRLAAETPLDGSPLSQDERARAARVLEKAGHPLALLGFGLEEVFAVPPHQLRALIGGEDRVFALAGGPPAASASDKLGEAPPGMLPTILATIRRNLARAERVAGISSSEPTSNGANASAPSRPIPSGCSFGGGA